MQEEVLNLLGLDQWQLRCSSKKIVAVNATGKVVLVIVDSIAFCGSDKIFLEKMLSAFKLQQQDNIATNSARYDIIIIFGVQLANNLTSNNFNSDVWLDKNYLTTSHGEKLFVFPSLDKVACAPGVKKIIWHNITKLL